MCETVLEYGAAQYACANCPHEAEVKYPIIDEICIGCKRFRSIDKFLIQREFQRR